MPEFVRLTRHGVTHARAEKRTARGRPATRCNLPIHEAMEPREGRRLCVDCRRELEGDFFESMGGKRRPRTHRTDRKDPGRRPARRGPRPDGFFHPFTLREWLRLRQRRRMCRESRRGNR